MFSSTELASYKQDGALQLFVDAFTVLPMDQSFLDTVININIIAPAENSLTILNLLTDDENFVLNAHIYSNGNLAITANVVLEILNSTTIAANQVFITNYKLSEEYLTNAAIQFDITNELTIINYGSINAKKTPSAIATNKLINHGIIASCIDSSNFIELANKLDGKKRTKS